MARDYYGILGVDRSATDQEIKKAYRKLAMKFHPDRNPGDEDAAERFREINLANEVLSDPDKRRMVDMGRDPLDDGTGAGPGGFGDVFGGGGLGDVFEAFFGGGATRGPAPRVRPGSDALVRTRIDLAESFTGVRRTIKVDTAALCPDCQGSGSASGQAPQTCPDCGGSGQIQQVQRSFLGNVMTARPCSRCQGTGEIIPDPCPRCSGDGRVRASRDISVNIPPGIADGMRVRLAGQGEVGPGGGPSGDLYVEVHTTAHPTFVREGDDLHITVKVPMARAALGTEVTLESLAGEEITVDVAAGTQPEQEIRLSGKGMPRLQASGSGDLIAHVEVTVPQRLDRKTRELLEKLDEHAREEARVASRDNGDSDGLFARIRHRFGR